ncbi:1,2-phenylacetyl-CoA epoxidase subunit PaaD [Crocinitomix catalasitica]|uniref:1,2-phenylacetyl-CoA epoxidase subunit PaaD n=1 Tax=Crocinitomix catalasitica TaxID=184607 RepID=UPI0004857782|nr:1,2-phenylacetyl-CoA epoxidase subunit PaaD [Crocinitomix catalasitica]
MVLDRDTNIHPEIWELLNEVPDPEIPAINLVELGVIRTVERTDDGTIYIVITPTYTGCPAKQLFKDLILEKLAEYGHHKVEITSRLNPAWTTDWMSDATKEKLLKIGISPPSVGDRVIVCPQCKSTDTKLLSPFGSVACQSMYSCNTCKEPFSYFKCH